MGMLLDATIKISLIVLLALAATAMLRRQSAALRHWVLATALMCAACVPVLSLVIPSWSVSLRMPAIAADAGRLDTQVAADSRPLNTPTPVGAGFPGPSEVSGSRPGLDSVVDALIPLWLTGVTISLAILLVGFARLTRLAWRAKPIREGAWAEAADEVSRAYGLRRPVRLLHSGHPALLVTWGLFRPKVIVPAAARTWPRDRVHIVLCHELAHIQRYDWAVQMTSQLLRAVYWFNPVVWIACRRLRQEGEQACDDLVLQQGIEGREYAWQLLNIVRAFRHQRRAWVPAAAMARPSSLEKRIGAMLNSRLNRRPATRFTHAAVAIALACITIPIAAAQTGPASFSGTLYDPAGGVVPNAQLVLDGRPGAGAWEAMSDEAGRFEFPRLAAGRYRLDVWGAEKLAKIGEPVTLAAGQRLERDITVDLEPVSLATSMVWDAATGEPAPSRARVGWPENWSCLEGYLALCGPPSLLEEFERDLQQAGQVSMHVQVPRQISRPSLQYPAALRGTGIQGQVTLEGRIGTDGFLTSVRVLSAPHPDLGRAAVDAARQARWEPARLRGVLVEVPIRLAFGVNVR